MRFFTIILFIFSWLLPTTEVDAAAHQKKNKNHALKHKLSHEKMYELILKNASPIVYRTGQDLTSISNPYVRKVIKYSDEEFKDFLGSSVNEEEAVYLFIPQSKEKYIREIISSNIRHGDNWLAVCFSGPHVPFAVVPLYAEDDIIKTIYEFNHERTHCGYGAKENFAYFFGYLSSLDFMLRYPDGSTSLEVVMSFANMINDGLLSLEDFRWNLWQRIYASSVEYNGYENIVKNIQPFMVQLMKDDFNVFSHMDVSISYRRSLKEYYKFLKIYILSRKNNYYCDNESCPYKKAVEICDQFISGERTELPIFDKVSPIFDHENEQD